MTTNKKRVFIEYTFYFLIALGLVFSTFILKRLSFVFRDDGFNQYFPVFAYTGRYYRALITSFFTGQKLPVYDFSIGLGGDILTYLNKYGITDIFNIIISTLCPARFSVYGYMLSLIAKMYVAGLTFLIYCRYCGYNKDSSIIGAISYSLSTFVLVYGIAFPEFMFPLVTLPVFILGIDSILDDKCSKRIYISLVLAVLFQAMTGFYMLYMESIFCIVWIISKIFFITNRKRIIRKLINILFTYMISVGLSSVTLFPVIVLYLSSTRSQELAFTFFELFSFYKGDSLASRFSSFGLGQWGIGLGISIIGIISIYELIKKRSDKHLLVMAIISVISYFNIGTGIITNGFSYSVDRYIFLIYFVTALVIAKILSQIVSAGIDCWIFIGVYLTVWTICTLKFVTDSRGTLNNRVIVFVIGSVLIMLLFTLCTKIKDGKLRVIICVLSVCMIGAMYNMPFEYGGVGWYEMFLHYKQAYEKIVYSKYGEAANKAKSDEDFVRIDVGDSSIEASLYTATNSTSMYLSIIEPYQFDFYTNYGISSAIKGDFTFQQLDGRLLIQKVLSVKYFTDSNGSEPEESDSYYPMGVVYSNYISEQDSDNISVIDRNYLIDKTVIINEECSLDKFGEKLQDSFSENVAFEQTYNNISLSDDNIIVDDNSSITISIPVSEIDDEFEYYICLNDFTTNDGMHDITIADKTIRIRPEGSYSGQDNNRYVRISSRYLHDTNGTVTIEFNDGGTYRLNQIVVNKIKMSENTEGVSNLQYLQDVSFNGQDIKGSINLDKDGLLFMNVPYSSGWECYVDGTKTQIYKADYGFMAALISEGNHDIVWKYSTPGRKTGTIISVISFIALLFVLFSKDKKSIKALCK